MAGEEQTLVPYMPTALRGERLLVLAPHPDDEVIACGGLIAQHRSERREVRVIIATDGSAAGSDSSSSGYRQQREAESLAGLQLLDVEGAEFLRFPDRQLATRTVELEALLDDRLSSFAPDLVLLPSPIEIHPDHVALSRAVIQLLQRNRPLAARLAMTRFAFYEVSQPIRPNTLVDISAQREVKEKAISAHASQTSLRDYTGFASGLNQYRAMTLPQEVLAAEAYFVMSSAELSTTGFSEIARRVAPSAPVVVTSSETPSVSTVVRTRNRLSLLKEAVASIRHNSIPSEIVVVNDGGESPASLFEGDASVRVVDLPKQSGRSMAMNEGVAAASGEFLCFLDDDDLFYANHVETLTRAAARENHIAYYADALTVFYERDSEGAYEPRKRLRMYGEDFDPALLVIDNFIPLITLMVRRRDYLDEGGFDTDFDLFEDWDFLLRLSDRGSFHRSTIITSEVRHYIGNNSLAVAASRDFERMAVGKSKIWTKHAARLTHATLAAAIEKQKRKGEADRAQFIDTEGRASHLEIDVARLSREKQLLLDEIRSVSENFAAAAEEARAAAEDARLTREMLHDHQAALARAHGHLEEASRALDEYRNDQTAKEELVTKLYAEIARLNSLLDTIYASRSWKLHQFVERISGRR